MGSYRRARTQELLAQDADLFTAFGQFDEAADCRRGKRLGSASEFFRQSA
jgi:hypothetical protein